MNLECPRCGGTGEEPGAPYDFEFGKALCSRCGGCGEVRESEVPQEDEDD